MYAIRSYYVIPRDSLIADHSGEYFRQWRPEIKHPDDIWNEIVKVTNIPGLTSAPKLQPIETRLVMLSTGMRAPMGIKVYGPDLESIEKAGLQFEKALKEVPSVKPVITSYSIHYTKLYEVHLYNRWFKIERANSHCELISQLHTLPPVLVLSESDDDGCKAI